MSMYRQHLNPVKGCCTTIVCNWGMLILKSFPVCVVTCLDHLLRFSPIGAIRMGIERLEEISIALGLASAIMQSR
jgi:hypothetical protein